MDELISRQDALKAINNAEAPDDHSEEGVAYNQGVYAAYRRVQEAPTVAAEPVRRGRWTYKYSPSNDPRVNLVRIICSSCGLITGQKSAYCPSCGARMDLDHLGDTTAMAEKEDSR